MTLTAIVASVVTGILAAVCTAWNALPPRPAIAAISSLCAAYARGTGCTVITSAIVGVDACIIARHWVPPRWRHRR